MPLGKREVMDNFFTPVPNPCDEETNDRDHYNYIPHHSHQHHHHHHHQRNEDHDYSTPGSSSGSTGQGNVHHQDHGHHTPEHQDHPQDRSHHPSSQRPHGCSDASPHSRSRLPAPAASYSKSHSCTSSSSSWSSEASIDKEAFLADNRPGPRHSLSWSSIPVEGQGFWDKEEEADLEGRENRRPKHQRCHGDRTHKLHRSHSKSDEGIPHANIRESVGPPHLHYSPLYKSASLGRSLAFNDYTEILLDSGKPKKTPSSILLPGKGILKNKQGRGEAADGAGHVRKAKSLEVLSTHVEITSGGLKGGKSGMAKFKLEHVDAEKRKEAARQNFVQEKLQFSAFLNEITKQVISPSRLISLGVPDALGPPSPGQASPKSRRTEHRAEGERTEGGQVDGAERDRSATPESAASDSHSHSGKQRHRHRYPSDRRPHQQDHTPGGQTNTSSPEHCPQPGLGPGHGGDKQHQEGHNLLLSDCTSSSPERDPCVVRRHHPHAHHPPDSLHHHQKRQQHHPEKHQHHVHHSPSPHAPCVPKTSHKDPHSGGLGEESDSSQNKDTASTTRTSMEHSDKSKQMCYKGTAMQYKDTLVDVEPAQSLQEPNEELRHSVLRTVARMECVEVELQKTQLELNSVKDSFNRLQESASSIQQSNKLLEQKLQAMALSMDAEQEGLTQRISELLKELTAAQAAMLSLNTVHMSSLLQVLLDKHFQSKKAGTEFLLPTTVSAQLKDTALDHALLPDDGQSQALVQEAEECGKNCQQGSEGSQHQTTAPQTWRREQGHRKRAEGGQKAVGLVGKEAKRCLPASLQIPPLQLTPQQSSPSSVLRTPAEGLIAHQLGSPLDVLSASSEANNPIGQQQQRYQGPRPDKPGPAALKSTGALQNFSSPEGGDRRDSEEDEIIRRWRLRNSTGKAGVRGDSLESDAGAVTYQGAQRMLNNFMRHLQPPGETESKDGV